MNISVNDLRDEEVLLNLPIARGGKPVARTAPRAASPVSAAHRRPQAPQRFNGIHRRRRKKMMW